jgi:hypothetical protein
MRQRGRRSSADLVSIVSRRMPSAPPSDLSPDQASIWRDAVGTLPDDWIKPPAYPLLAEYCRHVQRARMLEQQITQCDAAWINALGLASFDRLLAMGERETRAVAACARALRLTPQSLILPRSAGRRMTGEVPAGRRRLWDRE